LLYLEIEMKPIFILLLFLHIIVTSAKTIDQG
jgi:hypothetical protein